MTEQPPGDASGLTEPGRPAPDDVPEQDMPSLRAGIEAILLVVDEPVPEVSLAQILERPRGEVVATLRELAAEYTAQGRGFELREIAGGWRYYTSDTCAPVVERFVTEGQQTRLTQAALETLAVVAYRQPVSRARVSAVRGVNSDGVIRTLTLRGLIEEAGQDPETQAHLYRTTRYFLERLGLRDLDELPDLAPYLPDDVEGLDEGPQWAGGRPDQPGGQPSQADRPDQPDRPHHQPDRPNQPDQADQGDQESTASDSD